MLKFVKPLSIILAMVILLMGITVIAGAVHSKAAGPQNAAGAQEAAAGEQEAAAGENTERAEEEAMVKSANASIMGKAIGAAFAIGLVGLGGALAMGNAISKSADGVARQPEAGGQIQTQLMLGLVFIETVVIYALIVAILIIFVM